MFLGLRTVVYYVDDIKKARDWYSSVVGEPYFDEPFYVGFNVRGFELGLHPDEGRTKGEGQCRVRASHRRSKPSGRATQDSLQGSARGEEPCAL